MTKRRVPALNTLRRQRIVASFRTAKKRGNRADRSHQRPVSPQEMTASISELIGATNGEEARQYIAQHPELERSEVFGLLWARARYSAESGNDEVTQRLSLVLSSLAGIDDPEALQFLGAFSCSMMVFGFEERVGDVSEDASELVRALIDGEAPREVYRSALVSSMWSAAASAAARFHNLTRGDGWTERAVKAARKALKTSNDDGLWEHHASTLASALALHFEVTDHKAVLKESVELSRTLSEVPGVDSMIRAQRLANLARRLVRLHEVGGNRSALDDALTAARAAVVSTEDESPELFSRLEFLVNRLTEVCARDGDPKDLDEAIKTMERALSVAPEGARGVVALRRNLAGRIIERDGLGGASTPDQEDIVSNAAR